MKTGKFIAYLFYRYYSTGPTKDIPYVSTLCAIVMLLGLHFFQILVLFGRLDLLPFSHQNNRVENFFITALCLVPVFILVSLVIIKSELDEMHFEESIIRNGNKALVIYITASIAFLLLLVLFKNGHF